MITKEKVKKLWKLCFNDSQEFTEMYFKLRYKSEINIAIQSGDEIISALQLLPYPMSFCGKEVATSYVSGACTHPDYRDRGVMRQLLSQAFTQMLQNGVFFSTLIPAEPWLFDYYERTGYAAVFNYAAKQISLPHFIPSRDITVENVENYQEEVYTYLNKKLAERPCYLRHTSQDFEVIMADLALGQGILCVARANKQIQGVAIAYRNQGNTLINELVANNKDAEYSLLSHIKQETGCNQMTRLLPPDAEQELLSKPLGMARIINVKAVLQLYAAAFPADEMQIDLTDKQLSVNNGYYYLCNGKCMYSSERLPGVHLSMNIKELTARILIPLHPYMSLMLN